MNNKKTISTVIPTFNREIFLKEAILSSLNQTIENEIIVCNHGGTDGTDIMVKEFKDKIKYIKKIKNYGPHFCWLEGIMEASGEYIHLLNDDDWIKPKFIEECIKYFDDEVGFVFTESETYYNDINIYKKSKKILQKSGIYNISQYETYFINNLISPTSFIMRKKDIVDSLFQGRLPFAKYVYNGVGPDKLMILMCVLRYKKFGYVSEPLSVLRDHEKSITVNATANSINLQNLKKAYREVIVYYYSLKFCKNIWPLFFFKYFIQRVIFKLLNFIYKDKKI